MMSHEEFVEQTLAIMASMLAHEFGDNEDKLFVLKLFEHLGERWPQNKGEGAKDGK